MPFDRDARIRASGIAWGLVWMWLSSRAYVRSKFDPAYEGAWWTACALLGLAGVFAASAWANRSPRKALSGSAMYAFFVLLLIMNLAPFAQLVFGAEARDRIQAEAPRRPGEDDEAYCRRLTGLLSGGDRVLRAGAALRMRECGAVGREALPEIVRMSEDQNWVLSRLARDVRSSLEAGR